LASLVKVKLGYSFGKSPQEFANMLHTLAFNKHVKEYEEWFDKYPFVSKSEAEVIKILLSPVDHSHGLEASAGNRASIMRNLCREMKRW